MSGSPAERLRMLKGEGGCFPIGPRARVRLAGLDAHRYLNGQVSIDVGRIAPSTARPACLLTAKGKLCAPVFVSATGAGYLVEGPFELREAILARLERYLIADDATVSDDSTDSAGIHIFGPAAAGRTGTTVARLGMPGVDVAAVPDGILEATADEQKILRIIHGVPSWGAELTEETLVQEARLDEAAVDFDKGCYVGQEVVSRLRSVGRVNRRLFGFSGAIDSAARAPLHIAPVDRPAEIAGTLTSMGEDFELARTVALGYLHRNFEAVDRFVAIDSSGQTRGEVEKCEFPIR